MAFPMVAALLLAASGPGEFDGDALMRDVAALAADGTEGRRTASAGAQRARGYIARRLRESGLEPRKAHFAYEHRGEERKGINLWAAVPGQTADRWIVVTAHYDHVGIVDGAIHNGADDNASGVAALLALADALQRERPRHSVLLVALDAEEPGLYGARAFVGTPPVPVDRMALNVNLDMVSRGDGGELWAVGANLHPPLRPLLEATAETAPVPLRLGHDGTPDGGDDWTGSSDHAAFAAAGIPFVYFGVENHADYHRPGDDADKIDPEFFRGSVETILAALRRLDAGLADGNDARAASGGD